MKQDFEKTGVDLGVPDHRSPAQKERARLRAELIEELNGQLIRVRDQRQQLEEIRKAIEWADARGTMELDRAIVLCDRRICELYRELIEV